MSIQLFFMLKRLLYVKNPEDIKKFGTHLRKLREENNLSQQQLADMSDLAKTTIQRIENSKFSVKFDVLISISKALEIPITKLVDFQIGGKQI